MSVILHLLAFPASGRPGGALADGYTSDSKIRHSPGSAVAFLKRFADSRGPQRYLGLDVEGNKGLVRQFVCVIRQSVCVIR